MEDYNESYIIKESSAKDLNTNISQMESEGYVCVGNHTVVITETVSSMGGKVIRNKVEYAQRMSRHDVDK